MNPCSRRRVGDDPGLAPPAPQLTASQPGHHGAGQRPGRVKRRKTKRERNSAKFGRNAAVGGPEHRPGCRMLQRMLAPSRSSHSAGYAKSTPLPAGNAVSGSMPVIITQRRLSQHLGMFNREVKSADIERLLDPRSERETETETSAAIPGEPRAPASQPGTSAPAPHAAGGGPPPTAAPAARELGPSHPGTAAVETGDSQAAVPAPLEEKENVPPRGSITAAARELARELQTHLDLMSTFPGRNLISERRQTILSTLLDRHQALPDLSALVVQNEPGGGVAQASPALSSPGAGGQEVLLDSGSSGSRSAERGISGKRRRGPDALAFRNPSPVHTGEGRATRREDPASLGACEPFGPCSLHPTAVPSRHALLSGSALHTRTMASLAPPAPDPRPRAARCLWEPRTRLERATVAFGPARKERASEGHGQGHWVPFAAGDSVRPLGLDSRSPAECPLVQPPQYPCALRLSPELWQVPQTQGKRPPPELHISQRMERAASESQTSFDVLKSMWSPNQPSPAAAALAPRALAWPCPGHRAGPWELCSEPALLPQACSLHRPEPQLEPLLPPREARKPRPARGLLLELVKPRDHCQKPASVEPVRAPNCSQPWDPRARDLPEARGEGWPRAGGWDSRFPLGGPQQLHTLQQLPMCFFPPSEVLEQDRSPRPTLHGYLLEEGSPEAWVFPRMKLY